MHLRAQQVRGITIASRTLATADGLAARLGGRAVAVGRARRDALKAADIVVGRPARADAVLTRRWSNTRCGPPRPAALHHRHRRAARRRGRRRRTGAGLPLQHRRPAGDRAREPRAARQRARPGRRDRRRGAGRASSSGCSRAASSRPSSRCANGSSTIRQAELRRLEPRLASLPPDARARVDEITHLIVEKLLLTPTEQLKAIGDETTMVRLRRGGDAAVRARRRAGVRPAAPGAPGGAERKSLVTAATRRRELRRTSART